MPNALDIVQEFFPDVKKVSDADEPLLIEVTATDQKNSRLKDHNECVMAHACKRTFHARGVIVCVGTAYIVQKEGATRYKLPESVSREIVSFDRKGGFAEGTYKIVPPAKSQRLGARADREPSEHKRNEPKSVKKFAHRTTGIRVLGNRKKK